MNDFVDKPSTTELSIADGIKIQRAHRALAQKPGPDATPTSCSFDVKKKRTVLKMTCKKNVKHCFNQPIRLCRRKNMNEPWNIVSGWQ